MMSVDELYVCVCVRVREVCVQPHLVGVDELYVGAHPTRPGQNVLRLHRRQRRRPALPGPALAAPDHAQRQHLQQCACV